ncbi:glutathione S-transferase [Crassisporium funariophilum]|nr:glutathione S-transferase [Crassisporium funariophilum]
MVFKVYGAWTVCTHRVLCVLKEKDVPYELTIIDFSVGEHKSPGFLAKQPYGQTPYIDDDGFILYESRAICHYIAMKYADRGPQLVPTELRADALYQQASSVEYSHFNEHAVAAATAVIYRPVYFNLPADPVAFDAAIGKLSAMFDVYDVTLGKQKYIAGDEFTLADIHHLPYMSILSVETGTNVIATKPNVDRWFKDISSRPSWKAVLEEQKLAQGK